jgi:hypothetical protein
MGARYLGRVDGHANSVSVHLPVASGVTVTDGDFLYFDSGRVTSNAIAGKRLIGVAISTQTGNAAGTVKVEVYVEPNAKYLVDNDNVGTTFAASHVGTYFDLTGATGAQLVDTSTTSTTGQLLCLEYNPQVEPVQDDVSYGVFKIAEHVFNI